MSVESHSPVLNIETMNPIQVPLKMRVWAAVRNQPGSTVQELLAYLKTDKRSSVASALTVLEFNEVVYSVGGNASPKKYFTEVEVYVPSQASHSNYRKNTMKLKLPSIKSPVKEPELISFITKPADDKVEGVFNTLTFNECRDLYQRLHNIFG